MSTLDSWESVIAVIEQLQGLRGTSTANAATGTVCNSLTVQYLWRYQQPTPAPTSPNLAKKTWAALLKKKVPLRLATACCLVLGDHDLAAVPVADCPCGKTVGRIVWHALGRFAKLAGAAKMQHTALDMQCFRSFQQLEQSGVLQLLPDVLRGAADRLNAVFGAPPFLTQQQQQQQEEEGSANQAQHAGSGCSSSSSSSSSSKAGKDTPAAAPPASNSSGGGGGGGSMADMLEASQEARSCMMFIRELQFCVPEGALTALWIPDEAGTIVRLTLAAWSGSCQLLATSTQPSEAVL